MSLSISLLSPLKHIIYCTCAVVPVQAKPTCLSLYFCMAIRQQRHGESLPFISKIPLSLALHLAAEGSTPAAPTLTRGLLTEDAAMLSSKHASRDGRPRARGRGRAAGGHHGAVTRRGRDGLRSPGGGGENVGAAAGSPLVRPAPGLSLDPSAASRRSCTELPFIVLSG